MPDNYELKPNKTAFVNYRFAVRFLFSSTLFLILFLMNIF